MRSIFKRKANRINIEGFAWWAGVRVCPVLPAPPSEAETEDHEVGPTRVQG